MSMRRASATSTADSIRGDSLVLSRLDSFYVQCWFAFQCAVTVGATVLALDKRPITASLRPLGVYIYAFGSQSCATRLVFEGSAPLWPRP